MSKEEEVMNFLYQKVFAPILNSKAASTNIKSGVNITIARMNRLSAEKMVQYFWSALATNNALTFAEKMKAEGFLRFEDVRDDFSNKFNDAWLRS